MTSKVRGSKLSMQVVAMLEEHGYVVNVVSSSGVGDSDIIALVNGKFIAAEVKGKGDTLKTAQATRLQAVYDNGGIALVVYQLEDLAKAIDWAKQGIQGDPPPYMPRQSFTI